MSMAIMTVKMVSNVNNTLGIVEIIVTNDQHYCGCVRKYDIPNQLILYTENDECIKGHRNTFCMRYSFSGEDSSFFLER